MSSHLLDLGCFAPFRNGYRSCVDQPTVAGWDGFHPTTGIAIYWLYFGYKWIPNHTRFEFKWILLLLSVVVFIILYVESIRKIRIQLDLYIFQIAFFSQREPSNFLWFNQSEMCWWKKRQLPHLCHSATFLQTYLTQTRHWSLKSAIENGFRPLSFVSNKNCTAPSGSDTLFESYRGQAVHTGYFNFLNSFSVENCYTLLMNDTAEQTPDGFYDDLTNEFVLDSKEHYLYPALLIKLHFRLGCAYRRTVPDRKPRHN